MLVSKLNTDIIFRELESTGAEMSEEIRSMCHKILFENLEDSGENGDLIMVFGSPDCLRYRAPKAFELYLANRCRRILLTGGAKISDTGQCEAAEMFMQLLGLGVAEKNMILETKSMYTHENFIYSSVKIRELTVSKPLKILAVTSYSHMRRVMLNSEHYTKLFPNGTRFFPVPSPSGAYCQPDCWYLFESGRKKAAVEIASIIGYIRKGYLPDFEI